MSLVVTGLNHRTSELDLRERLQFREESLPDALAQLRARLGEGGGVIVSTCNRSEIYVNHPGAPADVHRELRAFLSDWHKMPESEFTKTLYEYEGPETVGHLFRVASSLDSMVVGEQQISGQVHDAYLIAHSENATDKVLNALFQKAFSVAKRVRSKSSISEGKVSVSSVAVDLAVSIFMDLADKTVMVIGSGEMAELTLKNLVDKGVGEVLVANRSLERAQSLSEAYGGRAVALSDLDYHLKRADILISATGAPGIILRTEQFQKALKERNKEPMFVIDIAVPRDIDAAVHDMDNVYLYDLDDLKKVADANLEARRDEIDRCLAMVETGVEQFCRWMNGLAAEPTIVSLSEEFNAIREKELEKTLRSLHDLDPDQREEIEYLSKRIVNSILQRPLTQLKREVDDGDQAGMLGLVRRLFGLKEGA